MFNAISKTKWTISIPVILTIIINIITFVHSAQLVETVKPEYYARLNLPQLPENIPPKERLINQADPAIGLFLVATDRLRNSMFSETVILIIDHGDHGSAGLIINRPSEISLSSAFPEVHEFQGTGIKIHFGGPVNISKITALIRSEKPLANAIHVLDNIYVSSNISTLNNLIIKSDRIKDVRVYTGHAGWWAGQLEREIMRGSWHVIESDAAVIFEIKHSLLWQKLQKQ
jgi:putative transcriptional regulator